MTTLSCPSCGARYRLPDSALPKAKGRTRCPKCRAEIVVVRESPAPTSPQPQAPPPAGDHRRGARRYSVVVVDGPEAGITVPIAGERLTIGREGTDLVLDDAEVSRTHAALEPAGTGATLKDLGSRNGTRVDGASISEIEIFHGDEFQVGTHTLMLIVTEVE